MSSNSRVCARSEIGIVQPDLDLERAVGRRSPGCSEPGVARVEQGPEPSQRGGGEENGGGNDEEAHADSIPLGVGRHTGACGVAGRPMTTPQTGCGTLGAGGPPMLTLDASDGTHDDGRLSCWKVSSTNETVPVDADGDGYTPNEDTMTRIGNDPGATEVCDGVDNDCDAEIDEDVLDTFFADADEDGTAIRIHHRGLRPSARACMTGGL